MNEKHAPSTRVAPVWLTLLGLGFLAGTQYVQRVEVPLLRTDEMFYELAPWPAVAFAFVALLGLLLVETPGGWRWARRLAVSWHRRRLHRRLEQAARRVAPAGPVVPAAPSASRPQREEVPASMA